MNKIKRKAKWVVETVEVFAWLTVAAICFGVGVCLGHKAVHHFTD